MHYASTVLKNPGAPEAIPQEAPRPLRIGFVVDRFDRGGMERCVADTINLLDEHRYSPTIFCLSRNGTASEWIERPGVPIVELGKRDSNDPRVVRRLAKALRENRIDLVQSHSWVSLVETAVARLIARVRKHVHVEQGTILGDMTLTRRQRVTRGIAAHLALKSTSSVIAVAEATRSRLCQLTWLPERRVEIIRNGVLPPAAAPLTRNAIRRKLAIGDDDVVVGSVGRLVPVKGFEIAIEASRIASERQENIHLLIVGGGSELPRLTDLANHHGIANRVHLVGDQSNIGDWLSAMDLYLNSSYSEGTSLSVMEAMSAGLPLIVTDVGDNAVLAFGCGVVVPPADPAAMAAAIERLAISSPTRRRMGEMAHQRYKSHFTADAVTARYASVYERHLQGVLAPLCTT